MSAKLARQLIEASSAEEFLRARTGRVSWRTFAALKIEVDRAGQSDLNQASLLVELIERLAGLVGDPVCAAFAKSSRARVLHLQGKHRDANDLYRESARAMRAFKLNVQAAAIQKQQVDALTHIGRHTEALRVARAARRVFAGDPVQLAHLETNVGNTYQMLDRYKKALEHYERARSVLAGTGYATGRALVDLNRANAFMELDRPDEALELLTSVARTFDRARQHVLAAHARYHIAYIEFLRGRYNSGLSGYYKTRERVAELGSLRLVAWCDLDIAEILLALSAFGECLETAQSARSGFKELEMPYESARAQTIAALAAMNLGDFNRAQSDLLEARAVFSANRNKTFAATVDSYLAELAIRRGDAVEASSRARRAHRVFARQKLSSKTARSKLLEARAAYLAGDGRRAERLAKAVARTVRRGFGPSIDYMAYHLIGKVARDDGNRARARAAFRRAVGIVEDHRAGIWTDQFKATFLADKIDVYEDAIRACLDEESAASLEEAFQLVEAAKSRGLADLLERYLRERGRRRSSAAGRGVDRQRLSRLIEKLNWYSSHAAIEDEKGGQRRARFADHYCREVARCEREIDQAFRRVEARGEEVGEIYRSTPASSAELQEALQSDETAVEYFSTGDEISAFVIDQNGVRVARGIASKRGVERTLSALRFQIEKFNYGASYVDGYFEQLNQATSQHLGLLYQNLVARVEDLFSNKRLIVIPHGALHYVPFHGLLNRNGYLVDEFEISYAPSARVLMLCRELAARSRRPAPRGHLENGSTGGDRAPRAQARSKLVALGLSGRDTPAVAGEISAIGSLFQNAVKLTGDRATRGNLLRAAPSATYLHLASHGYFRRDNPMFSFLRLADSNLNFYSLLDLKLKAEMVTLSACHTGVNRVFPGDELHGLMRGFLHAGAPSLVASLWATSDASTAKLMKRMYAEITGGASKRAALRAAQLAVKDEYGHPYYWAPFVLMGNPN